MIGHAVGRRHVGHQSVKSEQSVRVGGGTFGHTRRDIIALNIDRRLSTTASRALGIGRKIPESVRAFLRLSLFPSFVLFLLGLSVDSSAPQSVCPPTPAALIIGSAKLSPSNSSPTLLLTFSLLFASPATTIRCLSFSLSTYLSISLFPSRADTLLNAVPIGYY